MVCVNDRTCAVCLLLFGILSLQAKACQIVPRGRKILCSVLLAVGRVSNRPMYAFEVVFVNEVA